MILLTVPGIPVPQSSKKYGITKDGRPYGYEAQGPKLKKWRGKVAQEAKEVVRELNGSFPYLDGPIGVDMLFYYAPLKSQPDRIWKHTKPDLTNIIKATEDALTGLVWADDQQVVYTATWKRYAHGDIFPGVIIMAYEMEELSANY